MSELWGFQSGQSQRQADDIAKGRFEQSKGLFQLEMAEGELKLESQKFALDNAKQIQQRQNQAIQMMQMGMGKGGQGTGGQGGNPIDATSDVLYRMGEAEVSSGLLEEGATHLKQAADLQSSHAKIIDEQTKTAIKKYTTASNLMADVHDQKSWEQMQMIYQGVFNEKLDPKIANQPYSPQFIDTLKKGSQTALQKAQTELAKVREGAVKSEQKLNEAKVPYYKALKDQAVVRTDNLKKTGAGHIIPKSTDVNQIVAMITSDYEGTEKNHAVIKAEPVAEEAVRLMREDGLPPSEAYQKAYSAAKTRGDFWGMKPSRVQTGSGEGKPLDIPVKDGKADISRMTDNAYYHDPRYPGVAYVYDKAANRLVKAEKEQASRRTASNADEDEDEDEGADE